MYHSDFSHLWKLLMDKVILVDGVFDSLSFTAEAFPFLPAHFHEHLETKILHSQLKLFVLRVVRVPTFLQVQNTKLYKSANQSEGF